MENRKDIFYIHMVRTIACIMVVALHCTPDFSSLDGIDKYFKWLVHFICRPSVPLFFMVSGVLLLPVNCDFFIFLKKRVVRILPLLILWGIIYAILPFFLSDDSFSDMIYSILSIPVLYPSEYGGILWYLYVLLGIYMILPFLKYDLKLAKYYILIWICASIFLIFNNYIPYLCGQTSFSNFHMLFYFSGYLGYLYLGKFCSSLYNISNKRITFLYLSSSIILVIFTINEIGGTSPYSFLSIGEVGLSAAMFLFLRKYAHKFQKMTIIKSISTYSFGIYLSHIFIYRLFTSHLFNYSQSILFMIMVITLTFLLSWIFCIALSHWKISSYLIGYSK